MEYVLILGLVALGLSEWRARRQEQHFSEERKAWAEERSELLNRIQAPETAPYLAGVEVSEEPLWVDPTDDSAHEEYVEAMSGA